MTSVLCNIYSKQYGCIVNSSLSANFNYRVHLSKRRARGGAGGVQSAVSQLVVKHRELNENEKKAEVRTT